MLNVKIIGADSSDSRRLEEMVLDVADSMALDVTVSHVSDAGEMAKWQVAQMPALVVNERVVCAGRIPMNEEVASYLLSEPA